MRTILECLWILFILLDTVLLFAYVKTENVKTENVKYCYCMWIVHAVLLFGIIPQLAFYYY